MNYKFDTHVHTGEISGCGKVNARQVVNLYKGAGYDGIIITDHYIEEFFATVPESSWDRKVDAFLDGYKNALDEGRKIGLHVILGMELRFSDGPNDYLLYGIDDAFLKEHKELYNLDIEKLSDLVKGKDILIFQAHPFRDGHTPAKSCFLDGVEVYNANICHDLSRNVLAYEYAKTNNLKMSSGSDFHREIDLAGGGIIIPKMVETSADLVQLLNGNENIELITRGES